MELTISISKTAEREALFGPANRNLRILRDELNVSLVARGETLRISGRAPAVSRAAAAIELLRKTARSGNYVDETAVLAAARTAGESAVGNSDPGGKKPRL